MPAHRKENERHFERACFEPSHKKASTSGGMVGVAQETIETKKLKKTAPKDIANGEPELGDQGE